MGKNETDILKISYDAAKSQTKWLQGWKMANNLGLTSYILSRMTGTLYLHGPGDKEKRNIGLGLRSNRGKGKESSGYTKRVDGDKSEWFYSSKLQDDVEIYMDEFPEVFEYLYDQLSGSEDDLHLAAADIWPEDEVRQNVDRLSKFLKELPCSKAPMQECGSKRLNKDEVDFIVKFFDIFEPTDSFVEKSLSPKMLFFGLNGIGRTEPDGKVDFKLWDRVVNCRSDCACPLGWRGTVIGIVPETKETLGVGSCSQDGLCPERRGYRIPQYSLLKLAKYSKERRKDERSRSPINEQNKSRHEPNQIRIASRNESQNNRHRPPP